jgi:hypothetical protein
MDVILKYFNVDLRDLLKYPEQFTLNLDIHTDRITLIPDQTSNLLQIIKSDNIIKENLIVMIIKNLTKMNNNIKEVYLSTHGNDIVINIILSNELVHVPKELFTLICLYVDPQDLDNIRTLYEYTYFFDFTFWMTLVTSLFGRYLV